MHGMNYSRPTTDVSFDPNEGDNISFDFGTAPILIAPAENVAQPEAGEAPAPHRPTLRKS